VVLVTLPHLEPMVIAAFRVKEAAAMGCGKECEAFVNSAPRGATRELAPAGAATKIIISEKSGAILALLMPNPDGFISWRPLNDNVVIRTTSLVENQPRTRLTQSRHDDWWRLCWMAELRFLGAGGRSVTATEPLPRSGR